MVASKETPRTILVCQGTGCVSGGSEKILAVLTQELERAGLTDQIHVSATGCHGFCEKGPLVVTEPEGIFYSAVTVDDIPDIVRSLLPGEGPVERLFYRDPVSGERIPHYREIPFYSKQQRVVLSNCGHINPERIEDYIAVGGYAALRKVLAGMKPQEVIDEVTRAGLRGLGGAGFPTGRKWQFCHDAPGDIKYVVCNADEGDPGAFQDRSILEGDPCSVLEGMTIAGYAVGAQKGYMYVRDEYPLAVKRLQIAIAQANEKGFLGKNILGSGFDFQIEIFKGAGAFVCGEETALIASLEGGRGAPRPRPPFPATAGLHGKPTLLNNVKTYANVRWIINKGWEWFASRGTQTCKGTAIFSLTGKTANCGLIEVPMGISIREIIYDIGGGIRGGKAFKAVQTGGPSGGCLPKECLDIPVDFDSLKAAGAIMGSGGMVVMDEDTCMVDVARYFLDFTQKESCGQCPLCRLGTKQMLEILTDITRGQGKPGDIDLLMEIADAVKNGSLCALGGTAPNPVLTTLRYFRHDYEAHIEQKRCPALACKELIKFFILPDKCRGCGMCRKECPVEAIAGEKKMVHIIDQEKCIKCGTCIDVCPKKFSAIVKVSGEEIEVPREPIPIKLQLRSKEAKRQEDD